MRVFGESFKEDVDDQLTFEDILEEPNDGYYELHAEAIGLSNSIRNSFIALNNQQSTKLYKESSLDFFSTILSFFQKIGGMIKTLIEKVIQMLFGNRFFGGGGSVLGASANLVGNIVESGMDSLGGDVEEKHGELLDMVSTQLKDEKDTNKELLKLFSEQLKHQKGLIDFSKYNDDKFLEQMNYGVPEDNDKKFSGLDSLSNESRKVFIDRNIIPTIENLLINLFDQFRNDIESKFDKKDIPEKGIEMFDKQLEVAIESLFTKNNKTRNKIVEVVESAVKEVYSNKTHFDRLSVLEKEKADTMLKAAERNSIPGNVYKTFKNVSGIIEGIEETIRYSQDWLDDVLKEKDSHKRLSVDRINRNTRELESELSDYLRGNVKSFELNSRQNDPADINRPEDFPSYIPGTVTIGLFDLLNEDEEYLNRYISKYGNTFEVNIEMKTMWDDVYTQLDPNNISFAKDGKELKKNLNSLMDNVDDLLDTFNELENLNPEREDNFTDRDEELMENFRPIMVLAYNTVQYVMSLHNISMQQISSVYIQGLLFRDLVANLTKAVLVDTLSKLEDK